MFCHLLHFGAVSARMRYSLKNSLEYIASTAVYIRLSTFKYLRIVNAFAWRPSPLFCKQSTATRLR